MHPFIHPFFNKKLSFFHVLGFLAHFQEIFLRVLAIFASTISLEAFKILKRKFPFLLIWWRRVQKSRSRDWEITPWPLFRTPLSGLFSYSNQDNSKSLRDENLEISTFTNSSMLNLKIRIPKSRNQVKILKTHLKTFKINILRLSWKFPPRPFRDRWIRKSRSRNLKIQVKSSWSQKWSHSGLSWKFQPRPFRGHWIRKSESWSFNLQLKNLFVIK